MLPIHEIVTEQGRRRRGPRQRAIESGSSVAAAANGGCALSSGYLSKEASEASAASKMNSGMALCEPACCVHTRTTRPFVPVTYYYYYYYNYCYYLLILPLLLLPTANGHACVETVKNAL